LHPISKCTTGFATLVLLWLQNFLQLRIPLRFPLVTRSLWQSARGLRLKRSARVFNRQPGQGAIQ
jgi:hypothetical protein